MIHLYENNDPISSGFDSCKMRKNYDQYRQFTQCSKLIEYDQNILFIEF